jgi:hypothetical protein
MAGGAAIRRGSDHRRFRWRGGSARHVRGTDILRVSACPVGDGASVQRVRRHLRTASGHLGLCTPSLVRSSIRSSRVYHSRLLVHGLNVVRQSSRHAGSLGDRHFRGYPSGRRTHVHRRPIAWRGIGDDTVPLARPFSTESRTSRRCAALRDGYAKRLTARGRASGCFGLTVVRYFYIRRTMKS